ncbi:MAG: hypothetical protein HW416_2043 [Chloroflexi bacterium]|nr:hypothetical protein [Chloroflexota bacterium]
MWAGLLLGWLDSLHQNGNVGRVYSVVPPHASRRRLLEVLERAQDAFYPGVESLTVLRSLVERSSSFNMRSTPASRRGVGRDEQRRWGVVAHHPNRSSVGMPLHSGRGARSLRHSWFRRRTPVQLCPLLAPPGRTRGWRGTRALSTPPLLAPADALLRGGCGESVPDCLPP